MNKFEFQEYVKQSIRYLDGATGSNLMKAGMPTGVCPEQWILEHREVCLNLQKEYVAAGTDILYCPTFSGNRVKLSEYHLEEHMEEMITKLVGISKEAASSTDRQVLIAGDLTMTGRQLIPMGTMELEELIDIYKEQISYLEQAGVDLLVVSPNESSNLTPVVEKAYEKGIPVILYDRKIESEAYDAYVGRAVGHDFGDIIVAQVENLEREVAYTIEKLTFLVIHIHACILQQVYALLVESSFRLDSYSYHRFYIIIISGFCQHEC